MHLCLKIGKSFSRALCKNVVKPPKWFQVGERRPNILHARLRMLCSPLNDHLFSFIHVVDKPDCACGHSRENNKHYLLDCPLFTAERNKMLYELHKIDFAPTVSNLLNGDPEHNLRTNTAAFHIIQQFILDTRRFDNNS